MLLHLQTCQRYRLSSPFRPPLLPNRKPTRPPSSIVARNRSTPTEDSGTERPKFATVGGISKQLALRAVVAVLGLGFVDAGYSGDWSRIGVISKEAEGVLKLAAVLVVPLCLFVIYSIPDDRES